MVSKELIDACIWGGAVGDALGAPVEFMHRDQIENTYGESGITELHRAYGVDGCITDDTQLTLFTAHALSQPFHDIHQLMHNMRKEYLNWLYTQKIPHPEGVEFDGLLAFKEMWGDKSAGHTCLTSFAYMHATGAKLPILNDRKGCGALMRSAPFGLMFEPEKAFEYAAACADLSHNHQDGVYSAATFAYLVSLLCQGKEPFEAVEAAVAYLFAECGDIDTHMLAKCALDFARKDGKFDYSIYGRLGQGWTGEEALAIAIYCTLTAPDFRTGAINAVNHDGDSDSTGAIAGNLLGLVFGLDAIPKHWIDGLDAAQAIQWTCDEFHASM